MYGNSVRFATGKPYKREEKFYPAGCFKFSTYDVDNLALANQNRIPLRKTGGCVELEIFQEIERMIARLRLVSSQGDDLSVVNDDKKMEPNRLSALLMIGAGLTMLSVLLNHQPLN